MVLFDGVDGLFDQTPSPTVEPIHLRLCRGADAALVLDRFQHVGRRTLGQRVDDMQPATGSQHPPRFGQGIGLKIDGHVMQAEEKYCKIDRAVVRRHLIARPTA